MGEGVGEWGSGEWRGGVVENWSRGVMELGGT